VFDYLLRRLVHLLLISVGIGACVLASIWYLPAGVIMLGLGLLLFIRGIRRGTFDVTRPGQDDRAGTSEREAKMVVTQILRNLTQIQVSFLCQEFRNKAESRNWLKQALPRSFRDNLDDLHEQLERARAGEEVPSLELARQVLALRGRLLSLEDALKQAHKEHPGHAIAHPVIFVITEHLGGCASARPRVTMLAGWDPSQPALLPRVDLITLMSDVEGGKQVRGHAEFEPSLKALRSELEPFDETQAIYLAPAIEDVARRGIRVERVPLGFVIGTAELL